jgi:CTP synthase (UTP-ammonia lyase)
MTCKIAILGDFNPAHATHHALNDSTRQIKKLFDEELQFDWISTEIFDCRLAFNNMYCGLWIAPGSPYKDMDNVIKAIAFARENRIPTFGNCGGFQHMIIEFARNVCGISQADHEEIHPDASDLVIKKLDCSLVEQQEELTVTDKNSILFEIIKKENFTGKYFCSYGINGDYTETLKSNGLRLTAISSDRQFRAFEIKGHPFFLGTLFQPALSSTYENPNPLIRKFVETAINRGRNH